MSKLVLAALVTALAALAAERKTPAGHVTGEAAAVEAKLYADKDGVREMVGSDLGGTIIVVDVKVIPRGGDELMVSRDDFLLRSEKDGQRSQPFAPSQIAGRRSLVISSTGGGRGMVADQGGPIWGGSPGTADRPRRMGGDGTMAGSASASSAQATVTDTGRKEDDPLLGTLKEKILAEKKTAEPVSGLLYFHMEGKHKPKQLELIYTTPKGKLAVRFQ